jgi:hypothetical protein
LHASASQRLNRVILVFDDKVEQRSTLLAK